MALGKPPMKLSDLLPFLRQQYEDAVRNAKDGKIHTVLIIRADKDAQFQAVGRVLYAIQRGSMVKVGFITQPDAASLAASIANQPQIR